MQVPRIRERRRRSNCSTTNRRIWRHFLLISAFGILFPRTDCWTTTYAFSHVEQLSSTSLAHQRRSKCRRFCSSSFLRLSNTSNTEDRGDGNKRKKKKVLKIDSKTDRQSNTGPSRIEAELLKRVGKLEELVARQEMEIQRLKQEASMLAEAASAFGKVVELLKEAGLETPEHPDIATSTEPTSKEPGAQVKVKRPSALGNATVEYFDDSDIFGTAPSSVIDAADSAGAAILAGMLGGKQRMLVDVRDAELSRDPETLVQFIELAILPVAAGLEGLKSTRNRVKIVFPTVSQLLQYRRTMALAAPEVVALSTLGFDPVEKQDNIVVLIAPSPDDEEGLMAMNELLAPTDPNKKRITQPLVVLNHHMVPVSGPAAEFEVAYHLRLLSVQFMTGDHAPEYFQKWEEEIKEKTNQKSEAQDESSSEEVLYGPESGDPVVESPEAPETHGEDDAALEAAMKHAQELGVNQGVTRAMVIRAFPRPWHVFVDTSPDSDADFEVAATFDEEPSQDDVNYAIVECLEGSEHEDELVAQQMQQALEAGQLDRVSEMLGNISALEKHVSEEEQESEKEGDDDLKENAPEVEEDDTS